MKQDTISVKSLMLIVYNSHIPLTIVKHNNAFLMRHLINFATEKDIQCVYSVMYSESSQLTRMALEAADAVISRLTGDMLAEAAAAAATAAPAADAAPQASVDTSSPHRRNLPSYLTYFKSQLTYFIRSTDTLVITKCPSRF